jgi:hypothetical protein
MHAGRGREPAAVSLERAIQTFALRPASEETAWLIAADFVQESGDDLTAEVIRTDPAGLLKQPGGGAGWGDGRGDGWGAGRGDGWGAGGGAGDGAGGGAGDGSGAGWGDGSGAGWGDGDGAGCGSG